MTSTPPDDVDVLPDEYEVWQQDAFGEGAAMVASSTDLADAQHYAAMYGQDAPAWVVVVRRSRIATLPTDTGLVEALTEAREHVAELDEDHRAFGYLRSADRTTATIAKIDAALSALRNSNG